MKHFLLLLAVFPLVGWAQEETVSDVVEQHLSNNPTSPVYSISFHIENPTTSFSEAWGTRNGKEDKAQITDAFKIASCTKMFVATVILQLAEEQKLSLQDKILDYLPVSLEFPVQELHLLNGENHAQHITIEQLLSHRSGLANIFTDQQEAFLGILMENPMRQYSATSLMQLYYQLKLNTTPHFAPGKGWYYSDVNYMLLGLIIEQIDQTTLAASIRKRIVSPLKLSNTYFEYYEEVSKSVPMVHQYVGEYDFSSINTSFDWAGGGLVSTHQDLAQFMKALFDHQLISATSLEKMTTVQYTAENESKYGLGIYESYYQGEQYFGHYGFYGTYVGYSPASKTVLSYNISQAMPTFTVYPFVNKVLQKSKTP